MSEGSVVQFIEVEGDTGQLSVSPLSMLLLEKHQSKCVRVVCLHGHHHSGKSFLANAMLKDPRLPLAHSALDSGTPGLFLWDKPVPLNQLEQRLGLEASEDSGQVEVIVLESQGLGCPGTDAETDLKLLTLSLLLSSTLVFNQKGSISDSSLDSLALLTRVKSSLQHGKSEDKSVFP